MRLDPSQTQGVLVTHAPRRRGGLALLGLLLVTTTACGNRVEGPVAQRAAEAQLYAGNAQDGVNGQRTDAPSAGNGGAVSNGMPSGSLPGGGKGPSMSSPASDAASVSAPAGGNGGATDVGVTSTSISVGSVADLSGPIPGLLRGVVEGTLAYAKYINSLGGVYGRQINVVSADSQTQCSATSDAYKQQASRVFAFVGSLNIYDNCAVDTFKSKVVPDVSVVLSPEMSKLPNIFAVAPLRPGSSPTGMFKYYAAKYGAMVQHVGTLTYTLPAATAISEAQQKAAESAGWKFVYSRAMGATETNFTADIVRMRNAGVTLFFASVMPPPVMANFLQEANQQNWQPQIIDPQAYDASFLGYLGSPAAADGMVGWINSPLFFNSDEAKSIPSVALFQHWMHLTDPNQQLDGFAVDGWASAQLFVQALKAAGPKATRVGLLHALGAVHSFSADGLIGPADPAGKVPTICYVLFELHGGRYTRQDTPTTGYRCDGGLSG